MVVGSLGLLTPLCVFLVMGERARSTLADWRDWAARNNTAVMAVLFLVLGAKLVGDGVSVLT